MTDLSSNPDVLDAQGASNTVLADGLTPGTNLVVVPTTTTDHLRNLPDEVWDLSAESHLVRLAKVLLGDAGAGRVRKAYLLQMLRTTLQGAHFYDLDRFYGVLFGVNRLGDEALAFNPTVSNTDDPGWADIARADDSYRSRIEQFARAVAYGGTATGMKIVAEALLQCPCDVTENWAVIDDTVDTYASLEAIGTYASLEAVGTYQNLSGHVRAADYAADRAFFVVAPRREITDEERYAVIRVLNTIKPVGTHLDVQPGGIAYTINVPIRQVQADSEYWRVQTSSIQGKTRTNQVRPPFTAYQGEAWSHLFNLTGITSYGLDANGNVVVPKLYDSIAVRSNSHPNTPDLIPFLADFALTPVRSLLAGRSVSDGIAVAHPYYGQPLAGVPVFLYEAYAFANATTNYTNPIQAMVPLSIDSYPVALAQTNNLDIVQYGQKYRTFWASPSRDQADPLTEVVEFRLRSPQLVNYVAFELAKFPQHAEFQAFDEDRADWITLYTHDVTSSFPEVLLTPDPKAQALRTHPQHYLDGHWVPCSARTEHLRAARFRVVTSRGPGVAPTDSRGRAMPYSLAVRNLDVGYRVNAREDLPQPQELDADGSFASTVTVNGQTAFLGVYEEQDHNVLVADNSVWRCEPMPTNRAVVNLYVDVSDANGNPTVIDGFNLDPVKSGPTFNLYWANDPTPGDFPSQHERLPIELIGQARSSLLGLDLTGGGAAGLPTSEIGWDPNQSSWWFGAHVRPGFSSDQGTSIYYLIDGGCFQLVETPYTGALFCLLYDQAGTLQGLLPLRQTWAAGDSLYFSISYDLDSSTFTASLCNNNGTTYTASLATNSSWSGGLARPTEILFGTDNGTRTYSGDYVLSEAFLKIGGQVDPVSALAPVLQPDGHTTSIENYVLGSNPNSTRPDYTNNTVFRFSPKLADLNADVSSAFRGGPGTRFDALDWTPVPRDFKLTKGAVQVPQVAARFWCFEFSGLAPETTESFVPITRTVKLFPAAVASRDSASANQLPRHMTADSVNLANSAVASFRDSPTYTLGLQESLNARLLLAAARRNHPTSAVQVTDPRAAQTVAGRSRLYGMQSWQVGSTMPRFTTYGPHEYDTYLTNDSAKLSYYVGLRSLSAYRIGFINEDDTTIYQENFNDLVHIDPVGLTWAAREGFMESVGTTNSVATSTTYQTRQPVHAVQFATQQTDAVQLIPGDNFHDPRMATHVWNAGRRIGPVLLHDVSIESTAITTADIGSSVIGPAVPAGTTITAYAAGIATLSQAVTTAGLAVIQLVPIGYNDWHAVGDAIITYRQDDFALNLSRNASLFGAGPQDLGASRDRISRRPLAPMFSYRPGDGYIPISQDSGGIETPQVTPSPRGVLSAAVRVTGVDASGGPLTVQIIGADGTVLAQDSQDVGSGETVSFFATYTMGTYTHPNYSLYHTRSLLRPMGSPLHLGAPTSTGASIVVVPDQSVSVRLIQQGYSQDTYTVERMSLFDGSIVWDFSADGGLTWTEATPSRNNPNGVTVLGAPGNTLKWRATAYRPNLAISAIQIRPWYQNRFTVPLGIPYRGPNVSSFDASPPIENDPMFSVWQIPVPRWWWGKTPGTSEDISIPGIPVDNPYAKFLSAVTVDSLAAPTQTTATTFIAGRSTTETLTAVSTTSSRAGTFARSLPCSLPSPTDTMSVTILHVHTPSEGIMGRIMREPD